MGGQTIMCAKDAFLRDYWTRRREAYQEIRSMGQVWIWRHGLRWHVLVPRLDAVFVEQADALEGRWSERAGLWSFPEERFRGVVELAGRVYGVTSVHVGKEPR